MLQHFDEILLDRIRHCAMGFGCHLVWRLDDQAVLKSFDQMLDVEYPFRNLSEVETAIEYIAASFEADVRLQSFFERAITFLDFAVARDIGVLYSGAYQLGDDFQRESSRPNSSNLYSSPKTIVEMESLARLHALRTNKALIDDTHGGRWLLRWNLTSMVGEIGKTAIWSKASLNYVGLLSGEVDVFLSYPLEEAVFRSVEGRALLGNPEVTRVNYFVEHQVGKDWADKQFGSQPRFKERYGKELVFRTAG